MDEVHTGPTDTLPEDAELVLTAEHVMRVPGKGTIFVGRVACAELRPGDRVIAIGDKPICRGVVSNVALLDELLPMARGGDEVAVLVRGWGDFTLAAGIQLFLVHSRKDGQPHEN